MPIVLGTAGHIDHGKTSLVRALTGIDCDRLEEEKKRGITIELGFAYCDLPDGQRLGIVDVPGHERFIKNMLAGAAGIDFVMLVIAADEGVMPQTREHLEICSLLGIKNGFVALTKIDMVDEEWLGLVQEDIKTFLQGSFLENSPIFPVSSSTREGLDDLRQYIFDFTQNLVLDRESSIFRLPVDRVFTMKGHGTVITGTVIAGDVSIGQDAVFMPSATNTKIRNLQWHGQSAENASAGQRCAVNVQNVEVANITRGEVLTHANTLFPANKWFILLKCLSSAPRALRARTEIHFHHGAKEVSARLYFFDRDRLQPGESALCEVRFSEPMVGVWGDRCVIRAYSPLRTVAGGVLIHALEYTLRRKNADFEQAFHILNGLWSLNSLEDLALAQLKLIGQKGLSFAQLLVLSNANAKKLEKLLQQYTSKGLAVNFDKDEKLWIHAETFAELSELCLAQAAEFHKRDPLKAGMARGVLCPKLPPKLAHLIIEKNLKAGKLVAEGDILRLASHKVSLSTTHTDIKDSILKAHINAGLTPPNLKEVLVSLDIDQKQATPVIKILVDAKELVKVKDGLYYSAAAMNEINIKVRQWFESNDNLDVAALKSILGLSRKFLIALLEYMDRERITIRVGDARRLRSSI